jgi:hypothetical protein
MFNAENVKAILEGRKTQTRRVIKQLSPEYDWEVIDIGKPIRMFKDGIGGCIFLEPSYGQVGDRLWGRETWAANVLYNDRKPTEIPVDYAQSPIWYRTDNDVSSNLRGKWRPSIFMPRWASRINLEITNIIVERLQEINEEDALAEGTTTSDRTGRYLPGNCDYARWAFWELWDSLNPKYPWESNPWVWIISFKRLGGLNAEN